MENPALVDPSDHGERPVSPNYSDRPGTPNYRRAVRNCLIKCADVPTLVFEQTSGTSNKRAWTPRNGRRGPASEDRVFPLAAEFSAAAAEEEEEEKARFAAEEQEQKLAAAKLQAQIRGGQGRQAAKGKRDAALVAAEAAEEARFAAEEREMCLAASKLQAQVRGGQGREAVKEKRDAAIAAEEEEEEEQSQNLAASKLQAQIRGGQGRQAAKEKHEAAMDVAFGAIDQVLGQVLMNVGTNVETEQAACSESKEEGKEAKAVPPPPLPSSSLPEEADLAAFHDELKGCASPGEVDALLAGIFLRASPKLLSPAAVAAELRRLQAEEGMPLGAAAKAMSDMGQLDWEPLGSMLATSTPLSSGKDRLLIISSEVVAHEYLIQCTKAPNVQVLTMDYDNMSAQTFVEKIECSMMRFPSFKSIGIVTHHRLGHESEVRLLKSVDGGSLDLRAFVDASPEVLKMFETIEIIRFLASKIREGGRIDLLSCCVGADESGRALLSTLSGVVSSGVILAASTTKIGSIDKDSNWTLTSTAEVTCTEKDKEVVVDDIYFNKQMISQWRDRLFLLPFLP